MTKAKLTFLGEEYVFDTFGPEDHVSRILLSGSMYEAPLLEWLSQFDWVPGQLAFDIGAYLGTHSSFFSKGLGLTPLAFEPHTRAYEKAKANLAGNAPKATGHRIFKAAISEQGGMFSLASPMGRNNYGHTECFPDSKGRVGSLTGKMILEEIPKGRHVCLMKIDAEGMTIEALRSMMPIITKHYPVLCIEGERAEIAAELPIGMYRWATEHGATPMQCFLPTFMPKP